MKKRILSLVLAILLVVTMIPVQSFADSETPNGDVQYAKITTASYFYVGMTPGAMEQFAGAVDFPGRMEIMAVDTRNGTTYYQLKAAEGYSWPVSVEGNIQKLQDGVWVKADYVTILEYCDICKKYDCGITHETTEPSAPEAPQISGTVTDGSGNVVTDANGDPLVITVTGEGIPEGAVVSASVPEINGEKIPNVFDIKVLVDGQEWQPIDEGKIVTISIPVEGVEEGEYVDVYHYIDDARDIDGDEIIAKVNPNAQQYALDFFAATIDAYEKKFGNRDFFAVEASEKLAVRDRYVELNTNSFSIYELVDGNYRELSTEGNTDENGKYIVTFQIKYFQFGQTYDEITQYYFASPNQQFRLRTSRTISEDDPFSIVSKPDDAGESEQTTALAVVNNQAACLQNEENEGGGFRTRRAYVDFAAVDLVPGDVVWIRCYNKAILGISESLSYMKIVIVDEVDITFDKNLDSATLTNNKYGPIATDGDSAKNLFTIPTTTDYIPTTTDPRYVFAGWDTSPAGDGTRYTYDSANNTFTPSAFTPVRNMSLYAIWNADNYVINFDANGGQETFEPVVVAKGGKITLPDAPTRTDYVFVGWSATTDGYSKVYSAGSEFTVNQDVTLHALWAVNLTITIFGGDLILWLEDEFSSAPLEDRYYATSGNKMFEKSVSSDGVITYTAIPIEGFFKNARFTFTYDTNTQKEPTYGSVGTSVTFSGSSGQLFATLPATGMDANTTITISSPAKGSISYTVSYETNYGSPVAATVLQGLEDNTLQLNTLPTEVDTTRTGYALEGWYLDSSLTQKATVPMVITENITLYAKWTPIQYTVTFEDWDGDVLKTESVNHGAAATAPADPTREGYTFAGWDKAFDNITGNLTITALWTINQHTITATMDNGTISGAENSYDHGASAKVTFTPDTGYKIISVTVNGVEVEESKFSESSYVYENGSMSANVAIVVTTEKKSYTVTFLDWNGTQIGEIQIVKHGESANAPTATQSYQTDTEIFTFSGWDKAFDQVVDNIEVKALYTSVTRQYTFKYVDVDGTLLYTNDQLVFADLSRPVAELYKGSKTTDKLADEKHTAEHSYVFEKWEKDGREGDVFTFKAVYTESVNQYTITWIVDGKETTETYVYGAPIVKPADPAKIGYTFDGWDKEIPSTMPAEDVTITAAWTPITYTVTYDGNGGNGMMADQEFTYDAAQILNANTFEKPGHTFDGWKDADGNVYKNGQSVSNLTTENGAFVTLTAQWKINEYTVTFVTRIGQVPEVKKVTYGVTLTIPAMDSVPGFNFMGWNAGAGEGVDHIAGETITVTEDLTLTAVWEPISYKLVYQGEGVTTTELSCECESVVTVMAGPVRDGYTFTGWSGSDGNSYQPGDTLTMPASDVTLTAEWEVKKSTITFVTGTDQVIVAPITAQAGTEVELPEAFWVDYLLDKWWYDADGDGVQDEGEMYSAKATFVMPGSDATVTAKWKETRCGIRIGINMSYHINGSVYTYYMPDNWGVKSPAYHQFPKEPGQLDVNALCAHLNQENIWRVDGSSWEVYMYSAPSVYLSQKLFDDVGYTTNGSYQGLCDPDVYSNINTNGDRIKEYFKFDWSDPQNNEEMYSDLIEAWLTYCGKDKYPNADIPWESVLLQAQLGNGVTANHGLTRDDFKVVPYAVKRRGDGNWFVEVVVLAKTKHTLTYNLNMGDGYVGATAISKQWYGDKYQVVAAADPGRITKTVDGVTCYAEFQHWIGSDGNIYEAGEIITMTQNLELTAQWKYYAPVTIVQSGIVDSHTAFYQITGEGVNMKLAISGGKSATVMLPVGLKYTVQALSAWTWNYTVGDDFVEITPVEGQNAISFAYTPKGSDWLHDENHN